VEAEKIDTRLSNGQVDVMALVNGDVYELPSIIMELFSTEEAFDRGLTARCLPFIVETEPT